MRKPIRTEDAPAAVGPYSQAVAVDGWVWVSGQIPLDPTTGQLVTGDIAAEAERSLQNVAAVLKAAGCGMGDVVRATVYLTDLQDFESVNAVYARFFEDPPPARACVEVSALPKGARVEVDAVARIRE